MHKPSHALHALLLATNARAAARTDAAGVPVLLEDQDRTKWDQAAIALAQQVLDRSLRLALGGRQSVFGAVFRWPESIAPTDG